MFKVKILYLKDLEHSDGSVVKKGSIENYEFHNDGVKDIWMNEFLNLAREGLIRFLPTCPEFGCRYCGLVSCKDRKVYY